MKKIAFLLVALMMWSCSTDEVVENDFSFEILPIREVTNMPSSVLYNEVYTIYYNYDLPTTCHSFNDLYYLSEGNVRTVAVISRVLNETNSIICEPIGAEMVEGSFQLHVQNNAGTYIFKFWQGVNENGIDQYLVYEVPIE